MKPIDFLAIGDTVVDDFIRLTDARVHCRLDDSACEISMRWGDKIPFESSTHIAGVGNSANAAVSAARLGLSSSLITHTGKDRYGDEIVEALEKEGLDTNYVVSQEGKATNYHYVLWFENERTILEVSRSGTCVSRTACTHRTIRIIRITRATLDIWL